MTPPLPEDGPDYIDDLPTAVNRVKGDWFRRSPGPITVQTRSNNHPYREPEDFATNVARQGQLLVARIDPEAKLPTKARDGDAGYDLYVSERTVVYPGKFRDVHCGIRLQLPAGYWGRITGRSSTLRKRGLLVSEGVIDNGYTGPIYVGIWNLAKLPVVVEVGERLAQLILHRMADGIAVAEVGEDDLWSRDGRGSDGFGSSGT